MYVCAICMYVCMYVGSSRRLGINKLADNPARGQLNREDVFSPCPFASENLVSRDSFSCPVPLQLAHSLYNQAESGVLLTNLFENV